MARVVIFDFDGVIADTEEVHLEAFRNVLSPLGIEISESDYFSKYLALDDKTFFKALLGENGKDTDAGTVAELTRQKSLVTSSLIESCPFFEGIEDFIKSLAAAGFALAIASGALRKEIESTLLRADLLSLFSFVASAEDCESCKPNPEIFIHALKGLNAIPVSGSQVRAWECVVIEDSPHGISAAKAAGMKCVAVTNSHPREELLRADTVVASVSELDAVNVASF